MGCLILLTEDHLGPYDNDTRFTDDELEKWDGNAHLLYASSTKSKRVSSSTSHAETLSAVAGQDIAQILALRLTEALGGRERPTSLAQLTDAAENGKWVLPVDHCTDCFDVYDLITGTKGTPQDKSQRLYVMRLREDRLIGKVRYWIFTPTKAMLADALTKKMVSEQLNFLLTDGIIYLRNEGTKQVTVRYIKPQKHVTEQDLLDT
jgi:hypothetical protein